MKRILFASLMALALSCTREAPKPTAPFLLEFRMPEECRADAQYKNQRVFIKGSLSYEFETDVAGMVTVDALVPGIYDIITNWEMSGKEYKALLKDPAAAVEDKARVIVGVSLMNQRLFDARDMVIDLSAAVVKGLMISKVYYAGTKDKMGRNSPTRSSTSTASTWGSRKPSPPPPIRRTRTRIPSTCARSAGSPGTGASIRSCRAAASWSRPRAPATTRKAPTIPWTSPMPTSKSRRSRVPATRMCPCCPSSPTPRRSRR